MKATLVFVLMAVTIGCYYCLPLNEAESEVGQKDNDDGEINNEHK